MKSPSVQDAGGPEQLLPLPLDKILSELKTSPGGLTSAEAENRLETYGHNLLAKRKKRNALVRFLYYFRNPLVIILVLAGLVTIFFGEVVEAGIIFSIVLMSIVLSFYQESKAEQAAELLSEKVPTTATVLRDGRNREVLLSDIVPGDIVQLSAGDMVPADSKIVSSNDLFVDQSALTGESFPAEKSQTPAAEAGQVTERADCVFFGTSVVSGNGTAVVVGTGSTTQFGEVAQMLVARKRETDFETGLRRFGYLIMQVTFFLVIFVFFINALYKRSVLESLLFAVALAVGLTPELLPMIVSVNLSKGAMAMSHSGVIVKRLASIQNFGTMDILCTDKTGTLTENKIRLFSHIDVEGKENDNVFLQSYLNSYYQTGLRSPLDDAIIQHKNLDLRTYQKVDEIPFDFNRRRVSVVYRTKGQDVLATKGAPEDILRACNAYELRGRRLDLTMEMRDTIAGKFAELSIQGLRVLGVSYRLFEKGKTAYSVADESNMIFLGLLAFLDPPKETAQESLGLLARAKVDLKILTGDNDLVTKHLCDQIGFQVKGVVLGPDIAQVPNSALERIVETANIFARVTPVEKERIVNALRRNGHVVGFLGDGINDAPCIRTADVGISVDNAVDVAKDSADIILLSKDLTVLQQGVLEGRKTFGNTMKYVMMGTSSNFGNMFSAAGASLFLPFLPMLPEQILLNNLLYDVSELAIPVDNVDKEWVERPRKWDISFVRAFMAFFGPISSVFDFLTFLVMLVVFSADASLFQTGWFLESLSTQTLVIFVIRTSRSPFYKSRPSKPLLLTTLGIVAFALAVPFTPLAPLFHFVIPPLNFWLILVLFIGSYLLLAEILKRWFYKRVARRMSVSR